MIETRRTLKSLRLMKITALIKNIGAEAMRPSENWRPSSASAYCLVEFPTADFFQVWLKSSRSGDVASRACSPQVA